MNKYLMFDIYLWRGFSLKDILGFQVNVGSCGSPKPSPEPFEQAASLAGLRAQDMVHVGDDYLA